MQIDQRGKNGMDQSMNIDQNGTRGFQ